MRKIKTEQLFHIVHNLLQLTTWILMIYTNIWTFKRPNLIIIGSIILWIFHKQACNSFIFQTPTKIEEFDNFIKLLYFILFYSVSLLYLFQLFHQELEIFALLHVRNPVQQYKPSHLYHPLA